MNCDKCDGEGFTPRGLDKLGEPCDCRSRHKAQASESELRECQSASSCGQVVAAYRGRHSHSPTAELLVRVRELEAEVERLRGSVARAGERRDFYRDQRDRLLDENNLLKERLRGHGEDV